MIYKLLKIFQYFLRIFIGFLSKFIPKKNGLIIFCSDRYNENSRYIYEYLVKQGAKNIFWLSYNKHLTYYLKSKQMPNLSKSLNQIWMLMRASVVVASGNIFWGCFQANKKI